ncbi:SDR family oxidoreductase [Sphaerisporangium sp. NPDC051011]|uniref:SDR family NAD(P)-dependent oxidoreductase n=1 Tax=Sphaerisporangium sp. NPDC051011 TaxID=3155792 RepID=UPI003409B1DC
MRLEGKTAVVTGASSGLGRAIARAFAGEGAYVYAVGRRTDRLVSLIEEVGGRGSAITADVSRAEDMDRLYDQVRADGRSLDVVVANAGGTTLATLEEITPELLDREWGSNVNGTLYTVQKAVPLLRSGATVILMSSTAADKGTPGVGLYAAGKAAIRSFARTWANELKDLGVRVNCISPAAVQTASLHGALSDHRRALGSRREGEVVDTDALTQQAYQGLVSRIPLARLGEPDEVARLALFLATEDSAFITATNVYIDGGLTQV